MEKRQIKLELPNIRGKDGDLSEAQARGHVSANQDADVIYPMEFK